jgi:hypothetical protein|tara:strand:+ start:310 stop:1734 length:1425 start_codon:yes stop_codon:yes gene_type:complete
MKIEINCEALDKDVSNWYDTAIPSDISNALYHGYKIVSDPSFGRKIDENDVNEVSTLVREKEVLLVELQHYKQSLESIRADTINDCRELNKERLQEKEERIKELKQLNDTVTTDKQYLINEKDERIQELKKVQMTLEEKTHVLEQYVQEGQSKLQEEKDKYNEIMSSSYKKGEWAENVLEGLLRENVATDYTVKNVGSKEDHCADIHLKTKENDGVVLIESKFYKTESKHIITNQVRKFHSDIETCKATMNVISAVFVSISCDIPNITNDFECRIEKGIRCYYFANMTDEKCKLLYVILGLENRLFKERVLMEGNENMNQFLMRNFIEIANNYKKIENLSPGFDEIKKEVDKQQKKFIKERKQIIEAVKTISDNFTKLTGINEVPILDVSELLDIDSPHKLNCPQWDGFKGELINSKTEISNLKNDCQDLQGVNSSLRNELNDRDETIIKLEKKVDANVEKKPRGKKKGSELPT